jgi:hypothetical protein
MGQGFTGIFLMLGWVLSPGVRILGFIFLYLTPMMKYLRTIFFSFLFSLPGISEFDYGERCKLFSYRGNSTICSKHDSDPVSGNLSHFFGSLFLSWIVYIFSVLYLNGIEFSLLMQFCSDSSRRWIFSCRTTVSYQFFLVTICTNWSFFDPTPFCQ